MVQSRALALGGLTSALLSFRECQSDERQEQRALERNPGNGRQGHRRDPIAALIPSLCATPALERDVNVGHTTGEQSRDTFV